MGIEKYQNFLVYFSVSEAKPIYKLSRNKVDAILNEIGEVKKAEQTLFYYPQMIKNNIQQFIEYKQNIDLQNSTTKDILISFYNSTDILVTLNGLILNILTSFRCYIDNVSHMISEQFGDKSDIQVFFRETQKRLFDSDFSYRFMARYRNYVQHSGLPINDIVTDEGQLKYFDRYSSILIVNKSELLKYDGWGPVKRDFDQLVENIDVFGIIVQFSKAIELLTKSMFEYIVENKTYNYQYLLSQYKNTKEKSHNNDVALITKDILSEYTVNVFPTKFLENVVIFMKYI